MIVFIHCCPWSFVAPVRYLVVFGKVTPKSGVVLSLS